MIKRTGILIIIVIIIALALTINFKPESFSSLGATQSTCTATKNNWQDNNYRCVIGCIEITQQIANCVEEYGDDYFKSKVGKWFVFGDDELNCNSYYGGKIQNSEARYIGLYKCVPAFASAVGSVNIPTPDCNTGADTDCNGQVSRTELGEHINKWIANQVTRIELGQVIQAWVSG